MGTATDFNRDRHAMRGWSVEHRAMCPVVKVEHLEYPVSGAWAAPGETMSRQLYHCKYDKELILIPEHKIMFSTGMRDKNDVLIYEGDIVERLCMDPDCSKQHRGVVIYNNIWCMYQIRDSLSAVFDLDREKAQFFPPLAYGRVQPTEVVECIVLGNMYQHFNLLTSNDNDDV